VKLTTHLHPVPRSRMRGAIHPLPQYVFMTWCSVKAEGLHLYLLWYVKRYDTGESVTKANKEKYKPISCCDLRRQRKS